MSRHCRYIMDVEGGIAIADTKYQIVRIFGRASVADYAFSEKIDLVREMAIKGEKIEMPGLEEWEK